LIEILAEYGKNTFNLFEVHLGKSAVARGKTSRRWTKCAKLISVQYVCQCRMWALSGKSTINLREA
jgi:hypothetical protein